MNLNRENWAALEEVAVVLGMTPEFYLNEVVGRMVTESYKRDKVRFISEEVQHYSYATSQAAEVVADRINELSIVEHLNGSECVFSADVTKRENGRFGLDVDFLRDGTWNRVAPPAV
ncbi:MAG: hypothetical protein JO069_10635 [Verrucomicrobia bacterium]|nr:hypothetical protein [Verrucomicrobiota bacterium]